MWELVTLWVRNIPVEVKECKWIYEISYIWTAEKDMNLLLIIAVIHKTWAVVKWKPEKNSGLNGIQTHDHCDTGAMLYLHRPTKPCGSWSHWEFALISQVL